MQEEKERIGKLKILEIDLNRIIIRIEPKIACWRRFVIYERDLYEICVNRADNYSVGNELDFYIDRLEKLIKERASGRISG